MAATRQVINVRLNSVSFMRVLDELKRIKADEPDRWAAMVPRLTPLNDKGDWYTIEQDVPARRSEIYLTLRPTLGLLSIVGE